MTADIKLLTQEEVAEILRCSVTKVKQLRLEGALAYLPGRPVFILRSDLDAYIQRVRRLESQSESPSHKRMAAAAKGAAKAREVWQLRKIREIAKQAAQSRKKKGP